ncbi:DEKNAAC104163 [Brettanomyces naardenensis]|uniref:DEKNAAC104163 n=1 Tax=Brettanomyces naardenensis TaxID=13370 RepID=A0A448YQA4_BRENA|nr:DEKNAAC104163 [Brettanomyces naardenensis]
MTSTSPVQPSDSPSTAPTTSKPSASSSPTASKRLPLAADTQIVPQLSHDAALRSQSSTPQPSAATLQNSTSQPPYRQPFRPSGQPMVPGIQTNQVTPNFYPNFQNPYTGSSQQYQQVQPLPQQPYTPQPGFQPSIPKLERLAPGTVLAVGRHHATIVRYLSEGGFAHIYVVSIDPIENGSDIACLKRVIVPTKEGLNQLRAEVEVMQRLSYSENVVRYFDSNAARIPGPTHCYEVLVLMELCPNKSLLDYMNSRLATKLTEPEILHIMLDISKAVYAMHSLRLIHRDIKIENVLIDGDYRFKLCDFGSACQILPVPSGPREFRTLQNELIHQTTPQYRSPEVIDLYRGYPIDEKMDIWALGVFLYKLCYYTTPFETVGELGILHSAYAFPANPTFSSELKRLISLMLQENPDFRPNIYQVLVQVSKMMHVEVKLEDFYGKGEYKENGEEGISAIEPFTASKVPVYSPFKRPPRDFGEIQADQMQKLKDNGGAQTVPQTPQVTVTQPPQSTIRQTPQPAAPIANVAPQMSNSVASFNRPLPERKEEDTKTNVTQDVLPKDLTAASSSKLDVPKTNAAAPLSQQNTSTSTASLVDNVEERFPDIEKRFPDITVSSGGATYSNSHSDLSIRLTEPETDPKKRWSSNNPFPVLNSEQSSFESVEKERTGQRDEMDLIDLSNESSPAPSVPGILDLPESTSRLSLNSRKSRNNPFDLDGGRKGKADSEGQVR